MKSLSLVAVSVLAFGCGMAQKMEPKDTQVWEPVPEVVTPGVNGLPPSDATILFDGKDLSNWKGKNGPAEWAVGDGAMTVIKGKGDIRSVQEFGSIQLHLEWRTPSEVIGSGQDRGNSGIYFQERYELQVLDSYNNRTYSNGQAGAVYKQYIPLVNATRGPGEWQTYDVIFIAPVFNRDGSVKSLPRITAFLNGVLIQNNVELKGTTEDIGPPKLKAHGKASLVLQDHSNPVSYRNIWVREL